MLWLLLSQPNKTMSRVASDTNPLKRRLPGCRRGSKGLTDVGFDVSTATVEISARESIHALGQTATELGDVTGVIHAARVSPTQASPATILKVDLDGTQLVLQEFGM